MLPAVNLSKTTFVLLIVPLTSNSCCGVAVLIPMRLLLTSKYKGLSQKPNQSHF